MAEAPGRLLRRHPEARLPVDVARRLEILLRPERDLSIPGKPREFHAFGDEALPDPQPAGGRLDEEQPEPGRRGRLAHEKNGTDDLAFAFRDPASLARGVEFLDELRDDR